MQLLKKSFRSVLRKIKPNSHGLGIDIGSRNVKVALLSRSGQTIFLEQASVLPVSNRADSDYALRALRTYFEGEGIISKEACVTISAQNGLSRTIDMLDVGKDKVRAAVRHEAQQQIPFPIHEVVWDYHLFYGMKWNRREALWIALRRPVIEEAVTLMKQLGRRTSLVNISALALYNAMRFNEALSEDKLTAIIDVGDRTTHIVLSRGGDVWLRCIPFGGNRFTAVLEKHFELKHEEAEKLKMSHLVGRSEVHQVLEPLVDEWVSQIKRSVEIYYLEAGQMPDSADQKAAVREIFLCGGASQLAQLSSRVGEGLSAPVYRVKLTQRIIDRSGLDQEAGKTSSGDAVSRDVFFGPAIGIALQGLVSCPVEVNLLRKQG